MKNLALILALGSVFLFSNCQKDEPETYWYSYGTYIKTSEGASNFVIDLDDGTVLTPTQVAYIEEGVVDSSRVMVVYAIVSETDSTVNAKVDKITGLLTKGVLQLTEENQDSIGNDGVIVTDDDIWFSENHLNVIFGYYYYNTKHFINLVKPIGNQFDEKGNQILEFRHNDNNDYYNYSYSGIVSFDMWSLYEVGMDSLNFVFTAYDYDSTKFSWEGTYHYGLQPVVSSPNFTHYKKQTSVEMPQSEIRFR